jgi:hypothetical protein
LTIPVFLGDLAKILAAAELVTITERIAACRDPKDDKFLELAVNGRADLIVSGDHDLLALNPLSGYPDRDANWRNALLFSALRSLKNGGTLEKPTAMANHASARTTQLPDRRRDEASLDEVERIVI